MMRNYGRDLTRLSSASSPVVLLADLFVAETQANLSLCTWNLVENTVHWLV